MDEDSRQVPSVDYWLVVGMVLVVMWVTYAREPGPNEARVRLGDSAGVAARGQQRAPAAAEYPEQGGIGASGRPLRSN